jgi:hypothetical protein
MTMRKSRRDYERFFIKNIMVLTSNIAKNVKVLVSLTLLGNMGGKDQNVLPVMYVLVSGV